MNPNARARQKVVVIGLDAFDPGTLLRMTEVGRLPTLAALLGESARAETRNPEGLYVGALWASFATGASPARHGRHSPRQLVPGTYEARPLRPDEASMEPFWAQLARAGRRVAIVDVPHSHPVTGVGGVQVCEWGSHDPALGLATSPAELADEIVARFGRHPVHPTENQECDQHGHAVNDYVELRDALLAGVATKTALVQHLYRQGPWDLFVAVFCESHCVDHQCWHVHDPEHIRHDPEIARVTGDILEIVYIALDRALGEILADVDADTTVFVLASHGVGPHYDASFMFDQILRRLEAVESGFVRRSARAAAAAVWDRLPLRLRIRHPHYRDRLWRGFEDLVPLDPASRRYFKIDNNEPWGGVRINVVGREPSGKVTRGAEFDQCCRELSADLLALVNLETGRPLARQVVRTDALYTGENLDMLPDLLVEWENETPVRSVWSPKTGRLHGEYGYIRSGDHRPAGLVLVRGPGIPPGVVEAVDITDLAPTIAARLGVELEDCDGAVVEALVARAPA
jgi:predicted AlkP superfamily phosphohydrolase/phosphomutase